MNFKGNETATKLRGGYYTPKPIARFLCRWVLAHRASTILEPSCGDGAFIRAMKGLNRRRVEMLGIELLAEEATRHVQNWLASRACRATSLRPISSNGPSKKLIRRPGTTPFSAIHPTSVTNI